MANVSQVYYRVLNTANSKYETNPTNLNIHSNIISQQQGATVFTKVGIQAPPGIKVIMGTDDNLKTIMVGRSGLYELDAGIEINTLYFDRARKYQKDEAASAAAQENGRNNMIAANTTRQTALDELNAKYPTIPVDESDPNYFAYWDAYNDIQATYIQEYEKALGEFNTGVNGIYVLPNPDNPNAEENYQQLENIIVDYIYK